MTRNEFLKWLGFGGGAAVVTGIASGKTERAAHYLDSKYANRAIPSDPEPANPPEPETPLYTAPYPPMANQWLDRGPGALYDRLTLKAGQSLPGYPYSFFNYPVGSVGPDGKVRTYLDTNIQWANCLPAPNAAVVERVLFVFQPGCNQAERDRFISQTYFEFKIAEKTRRRAPLVLGAVEADAAQMVVEAQGKLVDMKHVGQNLSVRVGPCYIPSLVPFDLRLYSNPFYTPKHDLDMYVFLDGTEDRGVQ